MAVLYIVKQVLNCKYAQKINAHSCAYVQLYNVFQIQQYFAGELLTYSRVYAIIITAVMKKPSNLKTE